MDSRRRFLQACAASLAGGWSGLAVSAPAVWRVGPRRELATPSAAAHMAKDGDIVEIEAGVYAGDAAIWRQDGLTIRGVGGLAHLRADGASAEGKATWVIKGAQTTVESIEFSGATALHRNGAGIRQEGRGLTVRHCRFHHNENGILSGVQPEGDILVEHCEFAHNGHGDGYSHNLYIGQARSLTLRFCYVHHARVGHDVKSRALANYILYNRIGDEADGRSSYAVDLPDGGLGFVIGNLMQQGPHHENDALVAFGAEGVKHAASELFLVNNTLVNDAPAGGRFIFAAAGTVQAMNNIFCGAGDTWSGAGAGSLRANHVAERSEFVAAHAFDYRLAAGSRAIAAGVDPGEAHGFALAPAAQYAHKARRAPRVRLRPLDAGALEFEPA
ncbi:MAG: right-handed parallel beta-helix repeat-containing protein [Betaproteobacteria bacterium]